VLLVEPHATASHRGSESAFASAGSTGGDHRVRDAHIVPDRGDQLPSRKSGTPMSYFNEKIVELADGPDDMAASVFLLEHVDTRGLQSSQSSASRLCTPDIPAGSLRDLLQTLKQLRI